MKSDQSSFVVSVVDLLRRPGHRREVQLRGRLAGLRSVGTTVDADATEVFALAGVVPPAAAGQVLGPELRIRLSVRQIDLLFLPCIISASTSS